MTRKVFVDTAYLVALINPRDELNMRANDMKKSLGGSRLVITQTVLVETLNYFAEYNSNVKTSAHRFITRLIDDANFTVIEQTTELFEDGMKLYGNRLDKGYSLTDCISMNVCREHAIADVLTHDDHFRQEGSNVLL